MDQMLDQVCAAERCTRTRARRCERAMCGLHCRHAFRQGVDGIICEQHNNSRARPSPPCSHCLAPAQKQCSNGNCAAHCKMREEALPCAVHEAAEAAEAERAAARVADMALAGKAAAAAAAAQDTGALTAALVAAGEEGANLWVCARDGDVEGATRLLADGADANGLDECRKSPLFYASMAGHPSLVEALLAAGATDNPVTKPCLRATTNAEVASLLEAHYREVAAARARPACRHDAEWERRVTRPVVRLLAFLREQHCPPAPGTVRFELEQAVPDEWLAEELGEQRAAAGDEVGSSTFAGALDSISALRKTCSEDEGAEGGLRLSSSLDDITAQEVAWSLEDMCKICFTSIADCCIVPCGHLAFCMACMEPVAECPTCASPIEQKVRVYRS